MMRFNVGGWFLELPANFNLQLKKSNILFAFDNIALERTTSFSVPATPHNTSIFGWSNDFHYYGEKGRKRMQAQLQMDGVTKDGYLYITKYTPDAFECVFVTGELIGLADIKALGDWSQFILPSNGVSLDGAVKDAEDGNDYSAARVEYKTDGYIMPSWKLASYAQMALNGAGVLADWGEVLNKITSHRIVIGKAKGVTETPCTFTRGYLAEQTNTTPYPVLNSTLMDDAGELVGVITNAQSDYPIFKVKTADAVQYYGYVRQWIARQDLTLSFADDTPDTLFLASAQMNGTFAFLGGYEFAADGTITGEPLKGREIELQTGQTFLLISQNDYLRPGVGEFEGWTIANETLTANVVVKGANEQPNNAYIRVKDNLPEMTIVELLKTCAALSGTILSYRAGEVVFVEDIAGGAFRELDKPLKWESLTRGVADYAQRNTIAFKSAESVLSSEKIVATYAIDNVNIAEEKELFVLPFSEGHDIAGVLYIGSAFDGYTLGTWNAEQSNTYLSRVSLPLNASLQSILEQGTSIVAEVKMTEQKFDTLKNDMVLFFEHSAWVWTDGVWSNGVARLSLSKVSVESVKPLPPRIPLEYQEVEYFDINRAAISTNINWLPNTTMTAYLKPRINADSASLFTVDNRIGLIINNKNNRQNPFFILRGANNVFDYSSVQRPADNIPYTIQFKVDEEYAYLSVYQNGNLVGSSFQQKNPYGSYVAAFNTPLTLFGRKQPDDSAMYLGDVYEIKLFDEDMNLYAEFVPCYNKGNLVLGYYETFSGQFFPFTRNAFGIKTGPDVAPPERPWE
jgi:hypothetical protein